MIIYGLMLVYNSCNYAIINLKRNGVKMDKSLIDEFIVNYQKLSEREKFELGKYFNLQTGGKLSPFNNPTPVVVALIQIEKNDGTIGLLGIRRAIEPRIGQLALPGGFIDQSEDSQAGAVREVLEETGINTQKEDYEIFGIPVETNNNLLIFMKNKYIFPNSLLNKLKLNSEVSEFVVIDERTKLAFPLHEKVCADFFKSNDKIFTKKAKI